MKNVSFLDLISETWFHFKGNFVVWLMVAIFGAVFHALVGLIVVDASFQEILFAKRLSYVGDSGHISSRINFAFLLFWFLSVIATVMTYLLTQKALFGEGIDLDDFSNSIRLAFAKSWKVFYTGAAMAMPFVILYFVFMFFMVSHNHNQNVAVGIILAAIALFYAVRWSFAFQAVALDGEYGFKALVHSMRLVDGKWTRLFIYYVLVGGFAFFVIYAVETVFSLLAFMLPEIADMALVKFLLALLELLGSYLVGVFVASFAGVVFVNFDRSKVG